MGGGLARLLASKGFEVAVGHQDPGKAVALAQESGAKAQGGSVRAAAKLADLIVLAVPYPNAADALSAAGDVSGKVIVDISNPVTPDFKGLLIGHTTSAAEEIQKIASGSRVVKAWNTVFAELLPAEDRADRATPVQVFVAGDDEEAKRAVSDILKATGFEPVNSGPLSNSRYLEPVGEINIHFRFFLGGDTSAAPAWIKN